MKEVDKFWYKAEAAHLKSSIIVTGFHTLVEKVRNAPAGGEYETFLKRAVLKYEEAWLVVHTMPETPIKKSFKPSR